MIKLQWKLNSRTLQPSQIVNELARHARQVLSEELGTGDKERNVFPFTEVTPLTRVLSVVSTRSCCYGSSSCTASFCFNLAMPSEGASL